MKLDIFIVAYHAKDALAETLFNLAKASQPGYRLVVYDNTAMNYPLTWLWNEFFRQSRREFVALCNPDIVVQEGWDAEAIRCFDQNPDVAAVAPSSNFPAHTVLNDLQEEFYFGTDPVLVPYHCAVIRRKCWEEVGGFDPKIPFAGNDIALNCKFVQAGKRLAVALKASIWHKWNLSINEARRRGEYDEKWCAPKFTWETPEEMT